MAGQYLHSGEPLPLAPILEAGADDSNVLELNVFHGKLLDYLRRLTAKLSNIEFEPPASSDAVIEVLSVVRITSDFTSHASTTPETVVFNRILREDSPFSYNTTTGIITINTDGMYLFLVDLYSSSAQSYQTQFNDGTTVYPYGDMDQIDSANVAKGNVPSSVFMHLHETQTMRFQIVNAEGGETFPKETMRMTVLRLGDFTGTGSTPVDPCDFDIWQLCP